MTYNELSEMTVVQLRKLAKENGVILGSGVDKAGIIEKLLPVISDQSLSASEESDTDRLAEPKFQAAWHNNDAPRYNARPAYHGRIPRLPASTLPLNSSTPSLSVLADLLPVSVLP